VRGTSWLDAGCGEGRVARALAARGATVLGVDVAPGLVAQARKRTPAAQRSRLSFEVANLAARGLVPKRSLDGVVCALALQHSPQPTVALRAWARFLKPRGRLVVLIPHPCFMGPATSWRAELPQVPRGAAEPVALEVRDYPVRGVQRFRFDPAVPRVTTNHHFSLETWSDLLRGEGFAIERLGEPRPAPALVRREPAFAPYARVPFFLLIEARVN
jgi:SAM-dependent methyltransferase